MANRVSLNKQISFPF